MEAQGEDAIHNPGEKSEASEGTTLMVPFCCASPSLRVLSQRPWETHTSAFCVHPLCGAVA